MRGPDRRPAVSVGRGLLAALLILAALVVPGAAPAAAQDEAAAITVTAAAATPDFPNGIDFSLEATGPEPIVGAELYYRPTSDETQRLVTPDVAPGTSIAIDHEVDLRDGSLPPGVDVAYHWRLIEADGDALETAEQTILWFDTRFAWQPLSSPRVSVYAYNGDPTFNQAILATAEQTLDELQQEYAATLSEPVRIWVYAATDDLTAALPPNSEPWIAGAAFPDLRLILAVLPTGDMNEVGRVIPHEMSHQVLHQATENPFNEPPTWLDEGLAVHAQLNGAENYPARVAQAAADGHLDSIRALNSQFPYDRDGALLAYAESLSIVNFIDATYGDDGMARLIAVFREGVSFEEAVQQALGVSLDELDRQWQASLAAAARDGAGAGGIGDGPGRPDIGQALALASGSLVMALAALLAIVAGLVALVRGRRGEHPHASVTRPAPPA